MKVPVLVAVAVDVAELEDVCVGSDVKEAATLGVAWALAEAEAEAELEEVAEAELEDVAEAELEEVADAVAVSVGTDPTIIKGQQNWSVVEYKPVAKIHP